MRTRPRPVAVEPALWFIAPPRRPMLQTAEAVEGVRCLVLSLAEKPLTLHLAVNARVARTPEHGGGVHCGRNPSELEPGVSSTV
jgi:hypothetical protein